MSRKRVGKSALACGALAAVFCAPVNAVADHILKKDRKAYLGRLKEKEFRTCKGTLIDTSGGEVKPTSRKCTGGRDEVGSAEINALINSQNVAEAFPAADLWLEAFPDDITTMRNLTILASAQAIKGNNAYVQQGREYGARAIALLAAGTTPEDCAPPDRQRECKEAALVSLYRETGVLAYKAGDKKAAAGLLEKAAAHNSPDPGVYFLLSALSNDEYESRAKEYQAAPEAEKAAALQRVMAALDKVIESYARAVAVSEGNAQYQQANAAFRAELMRYYKFRHKNSTDGMQQVIDKYKQP